VTNPRFKNTSALTAEYLRQVFSYSPETGLFTRIKKTSETTNIGDVASFRDSKGYGRIRIAGKLVTNHRLAWLYMTGEWPKQTVDHINGVRDDNRWQNLREATWAEQCQNTKRLVSNTSGFVGVSFHKASKKWRAYISVNRKQHSLGSYKTADEAAAAYAVAKERLHAFQPVVRATQPVYQSIQPRRKRAYKVSTQTAAKISATKQKQFAEGIAYNKRDSRGCFVAGGVAIVARSAQDAEEGYK
jgi:hypothetical protein